MSTQETFFLIDEIDIVYDGQCPICRGYCERLKANKEITLNLIDARQKSEIMREINQKQLDIDEGMVVKIGDRFFYGSEAISVLTGYLDCNSLLAISSRFFFGRPWLANLTYPMARSCRNLLLRLMGVQKIDNLRRKF